MHPKEREHWKKNSVKNKMERAKKEYNSMTEEERANWDKYYNDKMSQDSTIPIDVELTDDTEPST